MRHRIAGHQQLKAIEPQQKVACDIFRPKAFVAVELRPYLPNSLSKKCSRAGCRVKDLDAMHCLSYLVGKFLSMRRGLFNLNLRH